MQRIIRLILLSCPALWNQTVRAWTQVKIPVSVQQSKSLKLMAPKSDFPKRREVATPSYASHDDDPELFFLSASSPLFQESRQEFSQASSVKELQQILVQKGLDWKQRSHKNEEKDIHGTTISPLERVRGCVATVYVQSTLEPVQTSNGNNDYQLTIHGTADAVLSRGLLATLSQALSTRYTHEEIHSSLLSQDCHTVADELGIRAALSPGRNDGLANMMNVIQEQVATLLQQQKRQYDVELNLSGTSDEAIANPTRLETDKQLDDKQLYGKDQIISKRPTVALLLSGGVDSSVALHLLLKENYNVTAYYLKIWLEDELAHLGQCPWEDDYHMCQQVCQQAGIPLESLSLQQAYKDRVISYTLQEAQRGRTPNPDILCNSRIKFGCFLDAIEQLDFDYVASGHYARLERTLLDDNDNMHGTVSSTRRVRLFRAPDPVKDQSYFLCALTQGQLRRVLFPLGRFEKSEVRELATQFQLPNRNRPDSQGLCFLGKVKFDEFLESYLGDCPGDIVDAATGDVLGRHRGLWFHTVGQRKGIGKVLNPKATSRGPWYVVAKDPAKNVVYCSNQYDEDMFNQARSEIFVQDIQWIAGTPPGPVGSGVLLPMIMKVRHGPKLVEGTLELLERDAGNVKLEQKDGGLAPGQYVVFYKGDECLGGGVISEQHWATFLLTREQAISLVNSTMTIS